MKTPDLPRLLPIEMWKTTFKPPISTPFPGLIKFFRAKTPYKNYGRFCVEN